jgi:MscS family membrane protein
MMFFNRVPGRWVVVARLAPLFVVWAAGGAASAIRAADTATAARTSLSPARSADTSSPRATLESFINACNEANAHIRRAEYIDRSDVRQRPLVNRILDCLDVSELPQYVRRQGSAESAICLKEILDRVEIPTDVPGQEEIEAAGGPEKLTRYQLPGTRISIVRLEDGPRRHEYVFSAGTVALAREYFEDMRSLPYRTDGPATSPGLYEWYVSAPADPTVGAVVSRLPDWFHQQWFEIAAWKWVGLFIVLAIAAAVMWLLYSCYSRWAAAARAEGRLARLWLTLALPVAAALTPVAVRAVVIDDLTLRGMALYRVAFFCDVVALLAVLPVITGLCARIAETVISSPSINPRGLDAQFTRIISRFSSLVLVTVVFLEGGHYLGFPVTTLLASAGVGGLAMALAAQDTLKNAFGTIMLMADKPFRVGERIIFDRYDGVVEEIGLRSTRLRLLTGHLATIPNDKLAGSDIENVAQRPFIRRVADIRIALDTPAAKLDVALQIVRDALHDHPGQREEFPPRVYLFDVTDAGHAIRMIYWFHPPNYWDYLAFSEQVNLEITRGLEAEGISFTPPMRITGTAPETDPSLNRVPKER